jgi:hypothetical protein
MSMPDSVFPDRVLLRVPVPTPVVRVVRREPLVPIFEILGITIDHLVNDARCKAVVADFYHATRTIENEAWLRRELHECETAAWVAAHL